MEASFEQWTNGREISSIGTNSGAEALPFQNWKHFKEAFPPEIVGEAVADSDIRVRKSLDPFGGSGTTALASQFLGITPTTSEVNPFLADLIEAKLAQYNTDRLVRDLARVARRAADNKVPASALYTYLPQSFIQPGVNNRWIFDRRVADNLATLLAAINSTSDRINRRLFRVLLGGILVRVSNVTINGKGRRYRKNWDSRPVDPREVQPFFFESARLAIADIHAFSRRKARDYTLLRGDCRSSLVGVSNIDLAIFSPPYPNSFDYTDVYNIELWMLGYLKNFESNRRLRISTLSSHVQVRRSFLAAPMESPKLNRVMKRLVSARGDLWDQRIPEMVGAYFSDLQTVLAHVRKSLRTGGDTWIVVGDSRYAGIQIRTAEIIAELALAQKWHLRRAEPFRSMRVSSQQGGQPGLKETLLVLRKPPARK